MQYIIVPLYIYIIYLSQYVPTVKVRGTRWLCMIDVVWRSMYRKWGEYICRSGVSSMLMYTRTLSRVITTRQVSAVTVHPPSKASSYEPSDGSKNTEVVAVV
jgi:hypothetical protein